jgi:hypothetical protein
MSFSCAESLPRIGRETRLSARKQQPAGVAIRHYARLRVAFTLFRKQQKALLSFNRFIDNNTVDYYQCGIYTLTYEKQKIWMWETGQMRW